MAKGSEILAFENSTGTNDKRQSKLQTQRMGETEERTGLVRGDYGPPLPATQGQQLCCVYMEQCVHGTAVNCLQARKEIDTAATGWPAFVNELSFCAS